MITGGSIIGLEGRAATVSRMGVQVGWSRSPYRLEDLLTCFFFRHNHADAAVTATSDAAASRDDVTDAAEES